MAKIIPKLGLNDLRDDELDTYAQNKVDKLTGNMAFSGIDPSAGDVGSKLTEYQNALSEVPLFL